MNTTEKEVYTKAVGASMDLADAFGPGGDRVVKAILETVCAICETNAAKAETKSAPDAKSAAEKKERE